MQAVSSSRTHAAGALLGQVDGQRLRVWRFFSVSCPICGGFGRQI
jgi:hypothetical protein